VPVAFALVFGAAIPVTSVTRFEGRAQPYAAKPPCAATPPSVATRPSLLSEEIPREVGHPGVAAAGEWQEAAMWVVEAYHC